MKQKNINIILPDGKYWHIPSNQTHKDKTTYTRKRKHKSKKQW